MTKSQCITGLDNVPPSLKGCALAIGNFDGVHLGHQKIIQTARELAAPDGVPVVAMTFEPHPEIVLHRDMHPQRVIPHHAKCPLLHDAGADCVVTALADLGLLGMSAREFVEKIIVERFAARHVVEGQDFHFGSKRGGDVGLLGLMGCHYGFALHVVPPVTIDTPAGQRPITSTLIRGLVAQGEVELAQRCLSRPFALCGEIIAGEGKGRLMDFPTANIDPGEMITPADAVYAGAAVIAGRTYPAAISVGHKPTLGETEKVYVEAFLIDASGDFYGQTMQLNFFHRLRGQVKFAGMEELRAAIARDVEDVRKISSEFGVRSSE